MKMVIDCPTTASVPQADTTYAVAQIATLSHNVENSSIVNSNL